MEVVVNCICYNNEYEIWNMLRSIERHVSQNILGVVIVDGCSTDKTVNLLESWKDRYDLGETGLRLNYKISEWKDDFAQQRNLCLDYTRELYGKEYKNIWVLSIDSDDTLSGFNVNALSNTVNSGNHNLIEAKLMWSNDRYFYGTRMFKLMKNTAWKNRVHEYITHNAQESLLRAPQGTLTQKLGCGIQHSRDELRNVRIGKKLIVDEPDNNRAIFYYARDLIECTKLPVEKRMKEAVILIERYFRQGGGGIKQDRYALIMFSKAAWCLGYKTDAKIALEKWVKQDSSKPVYEVLSRMCSRLGLKKAAERYAERGRCSGGEASLYHGGMMV